MINYGAHCPFSLFFPFGSFFPFVAPSGNAQNGWFSPHITLNAAGDPAMEAALVNGVASYGRQLGILTDAVLALANSLKPHALDKDAQAALKRLEEIRDVIEGVKKVRRGA
jgi:hypothetical protein